VDNAILLIPRPDPTDDQVAEYINAAMQEALSFGLTSVHDAATEPYMIKVIKR
jgi:predicted amidohydrolase YtcJ